MNPKAHLLTAAVAALQQHEVVKDGSFPSEFSGYIASLGAAITQMGLLPAWVSFSEQGGAAEDRSKLLRVIYTILFPDGRADSPLELYRTLDEAWTKNRNVTEAQVLEAAIATKMALRLFTKKKAS